MIQQIDFVAQLKKIDANGNATNAGNNDQSMPVLTSLEKNEKSEITFLSRNCNSTIEMVNYQKERVKLTNTLLNKLQSAAKMNKRATLRLNMKKFEDEELPHQLFITTRP